MNIAVKKELKLKTCRLLLEMFLGKFLIMISSFVTVTAYLSLSLSGSLMHQLFINHSIQNITAQVVTMYVTTHLKLLHRTHR